MDEKLYMVLADGWWKESWGSYVDFVGIFHTKEEAEGVIANQPEEIGESCRIVSVIVGEVHNMVKQDFYESCNEYACGFRLGGYVE